MTNDRNGNIISNTFSMPLLNPQLQGLEIAVPPELQETLQVNRHLMPKFVTAIQKAVQDSFEHPDTRMRGDVRADEVKLRVNLCYEAVRQMYFEEQISLIHALDILPEVIIDAIRMGNEQTGVATGVPNHRWNVDDHECPALVVEDNDMNAADAAEDVNGTDAED